MWRTWQQGNLILIFQTLATFLLVPILTNRLKMHDALVSRFQITFLFPLWYLLFFHQSWTFVLAARLLSSAISSVQGLVVQFPFSVGQHQMISVIKRSFKVYQLALTQKFDDISIPLGISRPSLVSLCPARRRLSGITESLKSNGNGKIFSDFQNLIQVPLVAFLGC